MILTLFLFVLVLVFIHSWVSFLLFIGRLEVLLAKGRWRKLHFRFWLLILLSFISPLLISLISLVVNPHVSFLFLSFVPPFLLSFISPILISFVSLIFFMPILRFVLVRQLLIIFARIVILMLPPFFFPVPLPGAMFVVVTMVPGG